MLFRSGWLVVFIVGVFSAALLDAQPFSESFDTSSILECNIPNPEDDHRDTLHTFIAGNVDRAPQPKGLTAQASQPDPRQIEESQADLAGVRERLEARIEALEAEWAAIKEEEEEINRIARGGTLRGSKTKKFMKRTDDFSQRVMKYNAEKEKLREDIEAYENAMRNASTGPLDGDPEHPAKKAAQTKAYP